MKFNLEKFTARVRHADAIIGQLSSPENKKMYRTLLSQLGIPNKYHSIPLYTTEVALAHLIPTIMFFNLNEIDDAKDKNRITVIRNALAHAGECLGDNKPNIELTDKGGIIFRTRNDNQEVTFNEIEDLANYISYINLLFSNQLKTESSK